ICFLVLLESTHIHSPKPESVQFNVGQVIVHRRFGYSGVIVGWDVKARAPEEWLQHKYPPDKQGLRDTPHYRILINQTNSFGKSTVYIPEEEITIIMGLEVVSFFVSVKSFVILSYYPFVIKKVFDLLSIE
uniref:Hemimethylated DNA-binding domain-containing protein n=1 Tax=Gopherus evgoodei TaxID=1825980 RepID=A0A8C4W390_9SAUR